MDLFNHFQNITLTQDQKRAVENLASFVESEENVFILQGYAGSGKTTLLKGFVSYLQSVDKPFELMAPTGRAAKVLRDKTEFGRTIHSAIYNLEDLQTINNESEEAADHDVRYVFPLDLSNQAERILIVDESSMISSKESRSEIFDFGTNILLDDLLTYAFSTNENNKIIFVGDPAQLPPVGDNNSWALDLDYFENLGRTCRLEVLTEVVRQDDNLILENANHIRNTLESEVRNTLKLGYDDITFVKLDSLDIIDTFVDLYPEPKIGNGVIISFSNAQCYHYNTAIRKALFSGESQILPGDLLMINNNNYHSFEVQLYNGDFAMVVDREVGLKTFSVPVWTMEAGERVRKSVSLSFRKIKIRVPHHDGEIETYIIEDLLESIDPALTKDMTTALYIHFVMRFQEEQKVRAEKGLIAFKVGSEEFKNALKVDPFYNALRVKYGYAITCHKSQGGEWDTVFVDYSGRVGLSNDALRWSYTATTRAVDTLYAINPPHFSSFSKLKFSSIVGVNKIPNGALSMIGVNVSPFHSESLDRAKSLKYWQLKEQLEGSEFSIKNVTTHGYLERYAVEDSKEREYIIQASHKGSGHFLEKFKVLKGNGDEREKELENLFNSNISSGYSIDYAPIEEHLKTLYSIMQECCSALDIVITNIDEQKDKYFVMYYLQTDTIYASIQFYFRDNGSFSTALPKTFGNEGDEKLQLLIDKLEEYVGL